MTFASPLPIRPSASAAPRPDMASAFAPRHFAFLLLDQFTQLAFTCALEPLRLANHAAGRTLYRWSTLSADGMPVRASNGVAVLVDAAPGQLGPRDTLVVVGGQTRHGSLDPALVGWLRRQTAHGVTLIGACAATGLLAEAGLIRGQRCAVHWELSDAFSERHPDVEVIESTFALDRIATSSGGAAAADLMLHLICQDHGGDLSRRVADQMVYSGPRGPMAPQRTEPVTRQGRRCRHLAAALRLMEAALAEPLPMEALASRAGASVRQVERLFRQHLGTTPHQHYLSLRLARARKLLTQTDMAVTEVALACGFASPSHFAKKYRAAFGLTAHATRQDPATAVA